MKKIFMLVNFPIYDNAHGIGKKIKLQIETLREMGYYVVYTAYTEKGIGIFDNTDIMIDEVMYQYKIPILNRLFRNKMLKKFAKSYLDKNKMRFDYAYMRFIFFDYQFLKLLKKLSKDKVKVIIEAHSYPVYKKGISIYTPIYIIDYIYSKVCCKYIDLVAAISDVEDIWGVNTVRIENGIDVNKLKEHATTIKDEFNFISVSFESEVHGNDRIIKGLADYYEKGGEENINIYFIGEYMKSTKLLVEKLNLEEHVFFVGKKYGEELDQFFEKCHMGIGILAPHRMNTKERVSLKTREYIGRGIPYICSCDPLSKKEDFIYAKGIESNDQMINIQEILEYYKPLANNSSFSKEMREFASKNLNWKNEFDKIFSILE